MKWNIVFPNYLRIFLAASVVVALLVGTFNIPGTTERGSLLCLRIAAVFVLGCAVFMYGRLFWFHVQYIRKDSENGIRLRTRIDGVQTIGLRLLVLISVLFMVLFIVGSSLGCGDWCARFSRSTLVLICAFELGNVVRQYLFEGWVGHHLPDK